MSFNVFAQNEVKSLIIGYSPIGNSTVKITSDDKNKDKEKYTYKYQSLYGASVSFEKQYRGASYLTEIGMSEGKMENQEFVGETKWFDMYSKDKIKIYTGTIYVGMTINPGRRFQLPIYGGIGLKYEECGQFDKVLIAFNAKVRAKFFLTNKIGIFGGYTFSYGMSNLQAKTEKEKSPKYQIEDIQSYADAGIIISF